MVVADLHVHTTNSDGTLALSALPGAARRAGVSAVAITDHDRPHPGLEDPIAERDGLTVVHGIELRVTAGDQRVDLLGYGVERTDALVAACERLQRDRAARGRAIVECLEARLDVTLPVEIRPGLGRPHIARAVAEVTDYDVDGVFASLIGDDGPCYVPRDVPDFERGRRLLAEACAVVGLAHPLRYPNPEAALALCADLDAVELAYPYGGDPDLGPVERAVDDYDLLITGGSDAHGETLGAAGLDAAAWARIREALDA
ncbi:MAG: PHP domain-containing protein [Haloarculaceae archaeon]